MSIRCIPYRVSAAQADSIAFGNQRAILTRVLDIKQGDILQLVATGDRRDVMVRVCDVYAPSEQDGIGVGSQVVSFDLISWVPRDEFMNCTCAPGQPVVK